MSIYITVLCSDEWNVVYDVWKTFLFLFWNRCDVSQLSGMMLELKAGVYSCTR